LEGFVEVGIAPRTRNAKAGVVGNEDADPGEKPAKQLVTEAAKQT
jgi:hypothetical protein